MDRANRRLKHERELRGITIEQMMLRTRISIQHLKAIEAGEFNRLPQGKLLRSLLVSYIRCLGLDPNEVLIDLDLSHLITSNTPVRNDPPWSTRIPFILGFFGLLAILLIWIAMGGEPDGMKFGRGEPASARPYRLPGTPDLIEDLNRIASANVALGSVDNSQIPEFTLGDQGEGVQVEAIEATWIKVFSISEGRSLLEMLERGAIRHYTPEGVMVLEIGDVQAIRIRADDREVQLDDSSHPVQIRFRKHADSTIMDSEAAEGYGGS